MQRTFSHLTFPLQRSKPSPERHRGSHAVFLSHHNTARYSWPAGTLRNGARSFDRKSLRVGRQRASLDQPSRTPCVRLLDLPSRYTRTRPVWYPQSLCLSRKTPRVFSTHLPDQLATRATLSVAQTTLDRETRRIAARHPPALALQLSSPVPCLMSVAASVTRRGQPQLLRPGRAALALLRRSTVQEQLPTPCAEAFWLFPASEVGVFGGDQCTALQSRWALSGALQQQRTMP